MTDALIPDSALIPADEFRQRLPEGWYVQSYRAEVSSSYFEPERRLMVDLLHVDGATAYVELTNAPDWDWLTAFLRASEGIPTGTTAAAERKRHW